MDEEGGKEQSEASENGSSLIHVQSDVDGTATGSRCASAEGITGDTDCRTETSQEVALAEAGGVSSTSDDVLVKQTVMDEPKVPCKESCETKNIIVSQEDMVVTTVAGCSDDANNVPSTNEHMKSPAGEQKDTQDEPMSGEKPSEICEKDLCETVVTSQSASDGRSSTQEKGDVRVLNDQALDSQPSTPTGKCRSEIFDDSMLAESPVLSEDGKLVIGTPRSVESPAIPGAGYEVDRTRHPADVGCEVEIAGDFVPLDCTPSTSYCTPNSSYCETPETGTDLSMNQTPKTSLRLVRSKKRKRKKYILARKKQRKMLPESRGVKKGSRGVEEESRGVEEERKEVEEENDLEVAIDEALDLDGDLERKLEENAAKNNLTAINVKSILHHVITNEHVLSMVRNTMTDAGLVEIEREPAAYTPKLTRAKLKEATEKVGKMPYVWPLSPVKNKKAPTPGFVEIDFSDDTSSDDEDYKPTMDELTREESDYESVTSQMSDFGSPCCSTPPRSAQPSITESEIDDSPAPVKPATTASTPKSSQRPVARHLQVAPVPMGPPPAPLNPDRLGDDDAFLRELAAVTKEEANIIAHRTRSKFPINKPLEAIEASFIAPDAEMDMYDMYESDHEDVEWKKWLASLYKTEDTTHTEPTDDEQNDPEYNFLAEEEPEDKEDFRTDRAVRVSKKELNELLDEVVEAYGDEVDWLDDFDMAQFDQDPQSSLLGSIIQQQKQKFSPSKFYTMPSSSSYAGVPSTTPLAPGASTSAKFSLGEALCSIMTAAAASLDTTPMDVTETTVDEGTATSATDTTAIAATEATVLATSSTVAVTEATMPPSSVEPATSIAAEQQHSQLPLPEQPPVAENQVSSAAGIQQAPTVAWTIEAKTLPSIVVNGEELQQMQQQLQQHVQLLCQMHLIAREDDTLIECANQSKQFLSELDLLAGVNEEGMNSQGGVGQRPTTFRSHFRPCNLGGALELLKTPKCRPDLEDEKPKRKRQSLPGTKAKLKPKPLLNDMRNMIAKSSVFLHAELLPKNMFFDISRSAKIIFVDGEDKLVARGLEQFSSCDNAFHLIQSLMMPCKTRDQIRNRIKNLTSHRKCNVDINNPIVIYKQTKKLSYSPSMCAVVKPHEATAPINRQNIQDLPRWVLNLKGIYGSIKDRVLEQFKDKKDHSKLSPLKPKPLLPQDQKLFQVQHQMPVAMSSSLPGVNQFPPEAPRYILASNVGLTAGGLILQSGQQFLQQGLLPRTVCEVKYVIDSPQMSPIASGKTAAGVLPSIQQSSNAAVPSPAVQSAATSGTNPVIGLPANNLLSLASIYPNTAQVEAQQMVQPSAVHKEAATTDVVVSSSASEMELPNTQADAKPAPHSVVRTLQFSEEPASATQTASEPMSTESNQISANKRVEMTLPTTQILLTTQEHDLAGTTTDNSVQHTHSVHPKPPCTVREMIEKRKKVSPRNRFGGFVSMSSLAGKGVSSLNRYKLGISKTRRSPERIGLRSPSSKRSPGRLRSPGRMRSPGRLRSPGSKRSPGRLRSPGSKRSPGRFGSPGQRRSPGRMILKIGRDKKHSPHSAKVSPESAELRETKRLFEKRTSDSSDDCIPLEAALRQLDEEEDDEEPVRTASPRVAALQNLVSLSCDESPSDITSSPVRVAEEVYVPSPTTVSTSPHSGPSPALPKRSPLQMTVRIDDKVAMEATVPVGVGQGTSPESMKGLTIGSAVGSASQILAASRGQSPSIDLPRTASIPEGNTLPMVSSLPTVHQEDTTSQMSEGAASANSNPKLPFDLHTDQSEMMASTATGGKSPTIDEQSGARDFLSGGEQGGPGEDGEEEMEMGRRSNVKVAAKRIKSKLRKDLESTVVLLDPDIVNQDPHKEEREFAFAKDFLDRVKEALHDSFDQYRQFLRVFNEHSEDPDSSIADLYYSVKEVLSDRPELIEEFTAFMPPDVALQCGVFLECLEFSKARLFLRQVEVHFYKQPAQIQRIVQTLIQWGETQRNYQDLKEALLPLLKGQPHLEQELSMLFPDSRPPENYMMDFEEIDLTDDKKMPCDDFEEIELSESEEEDEGTMTKQQGRGAADRYIMDPWKDLNDELQYGTRSCKCNCHETSQDSRVKRKTRHCAYCSARVTRAELISSLRGLGPRRPMRDGSVIRRRTGVAKRPGRGSKLPNGAKGEDDVGGPYPTNEAVNHLSEMCDNLADYLQDNPSATEDEDEVDDDEDEDEEGGDEDHDDEEEDDEDDHDDDDDDDEEDVGDEDDDEEDEMGVATGDDDDEDDDEDDMVDNEDDIEGHEDEEDDDDVAEDQDDEDDDDDVDGVASEDDADDEAEDGGEINHMTSGESTDDLTGDHSPCTSQGSRGTMPSLNSNSGSHLSTSPTSSHTTLLGSGVNMDTDSRSLTCSPTEFQSATKDMDKSNVASVDSENKDTNKTSKVLDTPSVENAAKAVLEASPETTPNTNTQDQGKDGDAPTSSEREDSGRRELAESRDEIDRREEEKHLPVEGKESMGDGEVREEPMDAEEEEQEGAGDSQQSSTKEGDGESSASVWNRDSDRVLLEACQEKGASEETFTNVALQLKDKTSQQVKERFAILMKLFHLKASPDEEELSNDEDDEEESDDDDEEEGEDDEEEEETES